MICNNIFFLYSYILIMDFCINGDLPINITSISYNNFDIGLKPTGIIPISGVPSNNGIIDSTTNTVKYSGNINTLNIDQWGRIISVTTGFDIDQYISQLNTRINNLIITGDNILNKNITAIISENPSCSILNFTGVLGQLSSIIDNSSNSVTYQLNNTSIIDTDIVTFEIKITSLPQLTISLKGKNNYVTSSITISKEQKYYFTQIMNQPSVYFSNTNFSNNSNSIYGIDGNTPFIFYYITDPNNNELSTLKNTLTVNDYYNFMTTPNYTNPYITVQIPNNVNVENLYIITYTSSFSF